MLVLWDDFHSLGVFSNECCAQSNGISRSPSPLSICNTYRCSYLAASALDFRYRLGVRLQMWILSRC